MVSIEGCAADDADIPVAVGERGHGDAENDRHRDGSGIFRPLRRICALQAWWSGSRAR
jgi:hypothetical protein